MFRRFVSLLLLPCVLLTQSAEVFGHAHGGGQPAGHDLRPHVHTNPVAVGSQQDHHHHGPGGHHHHHSDVEDNPEPDAQPTPLPEPPSDHDTDAVYVNATDAVVGERSEPNTEVESSDWLAIPDLDLFVAGRAGPPARPLVCGRLQPGHFCPFYIRHHALLI